MTEAKWLRARDPHPMLDFLDERLSDRKLRLFACACCRRVWDRLSHERSRRAVEVAERFADGLASPQQQGARHRLAMSVPWADQASPEGAQAAYNCVDKDATQAAHMSAYVLGENSPRERRAQAALLRDIAGNPFRPVVASPALLAWGDGTLPKLAQPIYDERAFDRLPILADAVEDAGGPEEMVSHLRSPGPHARGCWVVDLILGKA
jgi:hypothetical protein